MTYKAIKNTTFITAVLSIFIGAIWWFLFPPASRGLKNPMTRKYTLLKLIRRNSISNLPEHFSCDGNADVKYYEATDKNKSTYHLVTVTYDVAGLGDRSYSFVFDSEGKCLLRSKDRPRFDNGSMFDITNDGYIEKVFIYNIDDMAGDFDDISAMDKAIKVWRLSENPELLLHIEFKDEIAHESGGPFGYQIMAIVKDQRVELVSLELNEVFASFSWSAEKEQFVCQDFHPTSIWQVLCPVR
ncbi:hypothetical protein STSP2_03377 [Anaerohalosphaera lusitana]|uniref:Uncharacterized protein n=1 Tax=Anaerohalosphaera lusitana TaxID=1936003 RepID=A0A1U9NQG4_9BACT|nr:hypothetical protein [Anaerohalosphaera lusitana]AQT70172.1 hypothetical protein STSP2_03377 [Anaerohalosphaera lusitana]